MDGVEPTAAPRFVHGASGGIEPAAVEPGALLVGIAHPDHHRRAVGNRGEALLARAQDRLRLLARDGRADDLRHQLEVIDHLGWPEAWFTRRGKADRARRVSVDRE